MDGVGPWRRWTESSLPPSHLPTYKLNKAPPQLLSVMIGSLPPFLSLHSQPHHLLLISYLTSPYRQYQFAIGTHNSHLHPSSLYPCRSSSPYLFCQLHQGSSFPCSPSCRLLRIPIGSAKRTSSPVVPIRQSTL